MSSVSWKRKCWRNGSSNERFVNSVLSWNSCGDSVLVAGVEGVDVRGLLRWWWGGGVWALKKDITWAGKKQTGTICVYCGVNCFICSLVVPGPLYCPVTRVNQSWPVCGSKCLGDFCLPLCLCLFSLSPSDVSIIPLSLPLLFLPVSLSLFFQFLLSWCILCYIIKRHVKCTDGNNRSYSPQRAQYNSSCN